MARILVVDDSRLTRKIIAGALKSEGHEVILATNGQEGLEAFESERPDVVFSDLLMPVMDGFAMTTAIRALDAEAPIVVASADIQDSSRERCEQIGVTRMLNKPFKPRQIIEAVEGALAVAEGSAT